MHLLDQDYQTKVMLGLNNQYRSSYSKCGWCRCDNVEVLKPLCSSLYSPIKYNKPKWLILFIKIGLLRIIIVSTWFLFR